MEINVIKVFVIVERLNTHTVRCLCIYDNETTKVETVPLCEYANRVVAPMSEASAVIYESVCRYTLVVKRHNNGLGNGHQ